MKVSSLKHLRDMQLGQKKSIGWKDSLYSSLYSSTISTKTTESTPLDGLDWGAVFGFGFSTDGTLLAAACENTCMLLYDPHNERLITRRFKTHTDCVNCVRFLDNRTFATCSDDSTVRLWDARFLSQEIVVLKGHTSWVKNIEYCSSEGKLITSGFDGNIFSWDINNYSDKEKPEALFSLSGIMRTKITPDEKKLIVSTIRGYFLLIHDLNLDTLSEDLKGVKTLLHLTHILNTSLNNLELQCKKMFTRKRNRIECITDFPDADKAESINTMQVHPQGWCIASRNTTYDERSEWTCVHDIQSVQPQAVGGRQEEGDPETSSTGPHRSRLFPHPLELRPLLEDETYAGGGEDVSDEDEEMYQDSFVLDDLSPLVELSPGNSDEETSDSSLHNYHLTVRGQPNNLTVRHQPSRQSADLSEDEDIDIRVTSPRPPRSPLSYAQSSANRISHIQYLVNPPEGNGIFSSSTASSTHTRSRGSRHKPSRLLYSIQEPNVGRGFIKEQSFSSDGRVLASPFANCVRLLAFNQRCSEICDVLPRSPAALQQVAMTLGQKSIVLASTFSPTHCQFVAGAKDGSISFCSPKL
ncbi:DDB1- and CUL4-associated factor 10-like [Physella acuta]|uniref:DDB1- and CUL4-associated factor 10-like n=1 Tax=Physella acuta TaxID=109671 RepID=UPI0027DE412F|nr:DDB1- and CUL4-associated factor 10-like [Physella acuta]XP_059165292.1 DDB1- and CUL4-associated factor 10-like [Physella acuta]XP_059165298.1 DDB1- and CUL4-associated factor 10-like [Physella acuta]